MNAGHLLLSGTRRVIRNVPILGVLQVADEKHTSQKVTTMDSSGSGRILVFGDSNCIDSTLKQPGIRFCIQSIHMNCSFFILLLLPYKFAILIHILSDQKFSKKESYPQN